MARLLITGAAGHLGGHALRAARARGHRVLALVRRAGAVPPDWAEDPGIETLALDLAEAEAPARLAPALAGVEAVIHAAAALSGDAAVQARDTIAATRGLLAALAAAPPPRPRLVLAGSIAVYDAAALPDLGLLDETAPLAPDPAARDAYTAARLEQEALVRQAAAAAGLELRILRIGAVFGPGRLWNAHLGPCIGPVLLCPERRGQVPLVHVEHCAAALVLAAGRPVAAGPGQAEILNVVDDDLPDRARFLAALRRETGFPRLVLPLPRAALALPAAALAALRPLLGGGYGRVPGLLRPAVLAARLKPLRYANARLHARLDWTPARGFEAALHHAATAGAEG